MALKSKFEKANSSGTNRHFNSSKGSTFCPFLACCGWCVKENRCDFKYPEPQHVEQKHLVPCSFSRRKSVCLKGNRCDFSHNSPFNNLLHNPELKGHLYSPLSSYHQGLMIPMKLGPQRMMSQRPPPKQSAGAFPQPSLTLT